MTEQRLRVKSYIEDKDFAHLKLTRHENLYMFVEVVPEDPKLYVPTFFHDVNYEFTLFRKVWARTPRGIPCHDDAQTARNNMLAMKERTDRLAMLRCEGWCNGNPPRDPLNTKAQLSVVVQVIMPVEVMYTYNHVRR